MKNYILLPSDFRNSDICIDLLMAEGAAGYGVFVMLLEVLRECDGYKFKDDAKRLNFSLRIGDEQLVERVLHNYGLFEDADEGMLMCPVFSESMSGYEKKRAQKQAAGRARHQTSEQSAKPAAEHQQTISETSAERQQNVSTNAPNSIVSYSKEEVPTSSNRTEKTAAQGDFVDFGGVWRVERSSLDKICREKSLGASIKLLEWLDARVDDKHNCRVIADVSRHFKLSDNQTKLLYNITGMAEIGSENLEDIILAWRNAIRTKYEVKYPMNYLLSKLRNYGK